MKHWKILYIILILISCNGENVPDCFQNSGDLVRMDVDVANFSKITVFERLNLVLRQGEEQKVEIESGEFLLNEISAQVENDRLVVRNENGCNFVRDFGLSTIYVTSPNITEIRSSTGLLISSNGVLSYPNLTLLSESFANPETETTDGSFDLTLDVEQISIVVNGIAFFQLEGFAETLDVSIAAGDSRVEAQNLIAQRVELDHRGTNDIFINPQESVMGV
ncbi:MAG: head GIN domain-containing protein, partial [Bacteroidota bacterium]